MNWHAILPLKRPAKRKSRLASIFGPEQRAALVAEMLSQSEAALQGAECAYRSLLAAAPEPGWGGGWIDDEDRELNEALHCARAHFHDFNILVLLPDLPLVSADDIRALLRCAETHGLAVAPDRHRVGTNAIALQAGVSRPFAFGPRSFASHSYQIPAAAIVVRPGLSIDCDVAADMRLIENLAVEGDDVSSPVELKMSAVGKQSILGASSSPARMSSRRPEGSYGFLTC